MKASLQLKYTQNLTMTPQLQQAIKLLQLSSIELQQEIQNMLETNPMLERDESVKEEPTNTHNDKASQESYEPGFNITDNAFSNPEIQDTTPRDIRDDIAGDPSQNDNWERSSNQQLSSVGLNTHHSEIQNEELYRSDSTEYSLSAHLLEQLNLCTISERDANIAYLIIESLDDKGYLEDSSEHLLNELNTLALQDNPIEPEEAYELDEFIAVLHRVQQFDPPGIAAIDLQDCLRIQLNQLSKNTEYLNEALTLVERHLNQLNMKDMDQLRRKTKMNEDTLRGAILLIQSLSPYPGKTIESEKTDYVIPDIIVKNDNGIWIAELNEDSISKLQINHLYASFIKKNNKKKDEQFLKDNLQEARWFIKSLHSRHETLLKVAQQIMQVQQDFFNHGPEVMKPLVLHDIAELVGMHESTISRVTNNKYMLTPNGVLEMKYFFSSHVDTDTGGECSSTAIRALIKKLISNENKKKPLSDNKICTQLSDQGIKVARRTVAKYRESLSIPPSNERKQLL